MTHDPGGKIRIALPPGIASTAIFGGQASEYHYSLTRR